jgi:hypothetical protein
MKSGEAGYCPDIILLPDVTAMKTGVLFLMETAKFLPSESNP